MAQGPSRLRAALAAIDAVNADDPRMVELGGDSAPYELVYGYRMSARLAQFWPDASEVLQIAVRAQHIGRWRIARGDFPDGRTGYKQWRSRLAMLHAESAAQIAADAGYDQTECAAIAAIVQKRGLKTNPDTQALEDVACLVFLEHYFADFATKHAHDKLVDIVRKTWAKMSDAARAAALALPLSDEHAAIVSEAIAN